ncbi:hypothetical protein BDF20DRAFT_22794 [Mycotypha africana]|uniref:uncharacterized protein n=1 Tax=Mycotypha africana TaxID=64632 RepID=UPI002301B293|nr:uncharacterized protein BDF20DRAFT_22794 [Mycotypha africana]KAI8991099.1 hypothetical protein BDF20DRAFT_22794 [Mycotypha africana]
MGNDYLDCLNYVIEKIQFDKKTSKSKLKILVMRNEEDQQCSRFRKKFCCCHLLFLLMDQQTPLYKWASEEQINQFKQYLIRSTPTTTSLLGYLISYDYYGTSHREDAEINIWSSHPDPFETEDIVVWVIESNKDTIRILVNTEVYLDQHVNDKLTAAEAYTMNIEAIAHQKEQPAYCNSPKDEALYKKSKEIVERVLITFFKQFFNAKATVLFTVHLFHFRNHFL